MQEKEGTFYAQKSKISGAKKISDFHGKKVHQKRKNDNTKINTSESPS